MKINRILYIEDSLDKYMDVAGLLKRMHYKVTWVKDEEEALKELQEKQSGEEAYDLILSDMHFEFKGALDEEAGIKTMELLRAEGYTLPTVFCSSQNWKVEGSVGNIFYHPRRDWESEAQMLFQKIQKEL